MWSLAKVGSEITFQKSIVVHHTKYSYDLVLIWPGIKPHTCSIETRHTNESSCKKGKRKKNPSPYSSSVLRTASTNCYCEQPAQPESLEVCQCSSLIPNIALILNFKLHVWHLNIYKSKIPNDRNDKHTFEEKLCKIPGTSKRSMMSQKSQVLTSKWFPKQRFGGINVLLWGGW